MKRGQITIFIIIGLMLLVGAGIVLYITTGAEERVAQQVPGITAMTLDRQQIIEYVNACIKDTATKGVYLISLQGGYINPNGDINYGEPGNHLPMQYYIENGIVPYAVDGRKNTLRPLTHIMTVLSGYIAVELDKCLNFSTLEKQGYNVTKPEIDWASIGFDFSKATVDYSATPVIIAAESRAQDVIITASYPLLFSRAGHSIEVSDFVVIAPLRLSLVYEKAFKLASAASNSRTYLLQQHCAEYSSQDGLVNIYTKPAPYELDTLVSVVDAKPVESAMTPLRFNFAVKGMRLIGECTG